MNSRIPLLAPRALAEFSPEEFHAYVRSLYVMPPVPLPKADWSVRLNAKGNPVLTVRRAPKYLTPDEVRAVATEIGWTLQATWVHIIKGRKVRIAATQAAAEAQITEEQNVSVRGAAKKVRRTRKAREDK